MGSEYGYDPQELVTWTYYEASDDYLFRIKGHPHRWSFSLGNHDQANDLKHMIAVAFVLGADFKSEQLRDLLGVKNT
jgi:hypothetical protein